jgi:hypothetical protein
MKLDASNHDPSTVERRVLALALAALGALLAVLIWFRPASLLVIGCISGLAWCASMLFNREEPIRQWRGVWIPLVVGGLYAMTQLVESRAVIAIAAGVALAVIGITVWFRERFGSRFYQAWSLLFLPLAWSVSTLLLILVYYAVLTPIGLALRMAGRDPLHRKFDRDSASYWVRRDETANAERYFRQF